MNERQIGEADERLNPRRSHPRYYVLRLLRAALSDVTQHLRPEDTLLDMGCGSMPYRQLLAPHVRRYLGADIGENQLADIAFGADGRVPLDGASIDVVISTQVLEHVDSPAEYLSEARRLLKDDGTLILSTHGIWVYHPDPTDLWRWTEQGLQKQLYEAGFEVKALEPLMGLASSSLQLLQDAFHWRLPTPLRMPFAWCMQRLIAVADRYDRRTGGSDACVFVVLARPLGSGGPG